MARKVEIMSQGEAAESEAKADAKPYKMQSRSSFKKNGPLHTASCTCSYCTYKPNAGVGRPDPRAFENWITTLPESHMHGRYKVWRDPETDKWYASNGWSLHQSNTVENLHKALDILEGRI